MMRQIKIRLKPETFAQLEQHAEENAATVAAVIRRIVENYYTTKHGVKTAEAVEKKKKN